MKNSILDSLNNEEDKEEAENITNPYTNRPYSREYFKILKQRKKLPVFDFKDRIIESVRNNKVTIIEGSTGSGKTTQIPQFLLEADIIPQIKK